MNDGAVYSKALTELVEAKGSEGFFRFFQTSRRLQTYVERYSLEEREREYLAEFCEFLLREQIFSAMDSEDVAFAATREGAYRRPALVREGEKRLNDYSFSYP